MIRIKLFSRRNEMQETQNLINEWLQNHQNSVEIIDIKCEDNYICIVYKPLERN